MRTLFLTAILLWCSHGSFAQKKTFDEKLAKSLGADERGMKKYVFCLLKTGSNKTATKEESDKAFEGHMANISRLAKEGKLVVAGPFMKNDKDYRGIYVFNASTIAEAEALVETDPAIKNKLLEAELTIWYATAALMEIPKIHDRISKK